ncbi:MAG: hypothetical protein EBS53_14830 [Bacteroidetes bacterium]|nr:hypothetical protein [Bacteroidota bacterium]
MRAREFVINVPITIKINGDGDPEISTDQPDDEPELDSMVPPLQQKIEIMKRNSGLPNAFDDQENDEDEPFE